MSWLMFVQEEAKLAGTKQLFSMLDVWQKIGMLLTPAGLVQVARTQRACLAPFFHDLAGCKMLGDAMEH